MHRFDHLIFADHRSRVLQVRVLFFDAFFVLEKLTLPFGSGCFQLFVGVKELFDGHFELLRVVVQLLRKGDLSRAQLQMVLRFEFTRVTRPSSHARVGYERSLVEHLTRFSLGSP